MTDAPDTETRPVLRRVRAPWVTPALNALALGLSIGALVVSCFAAWDTWAQVDAIKESTSESLVLMGMSAGILHAVSENDMGDRGGRIVASIQPDETLSVWMDIANNGRAGGSITELSYLAVGKPAIPIYVVKCAARDAIMVQDCYLPIALEQGQQIRIRVDFSPDERKVLNCPTRIDLLAFTVTDSTGHDLNVATENEEPIWDCAK